MLKSKSDAVKTDDITTTPTSLKLEPLQITALSRLQLHPLYESPVLLCLDGIAALIRGELDGLSSSSSSSSASSCHQYKKSISSDQYLCTNLELYTTFEPDLFVGMALLHNRIRQVVYKHKAKNGALGSVYKLHCMDNVNHRFRVYCYEDENV